MQDMDLELASLDQWPDAHTEQEEAHMQDINLQLTALD